jgi:hypothetical protein
VWPSCRNCGCVAFVPELWMRGLRALYVLSAIEPTSFLQVLETSRAGEVLPKFCTYSAVFFVLQSRTCRREPGARRLVSTATLGIIELFPYRCRMLIGVAQLGVSRPK